MIHPSYLPRLDRQETCQERNWAIMQQASGALNPAQRNNINTGAPIKRPLEMAIEMAASSNKALEDIDGRLTAICERLFGSADRQPPEPAGPNSTGILDLLAAELHTAHKICTGIEVLLSQLERLV